MHLVLQTNEAEEIAEITNCLADFRGADITTSTQAEKDKKIVEGLPAYADIAREQAARGAIPEREDGPNIRDVAKVMVGVSVYIASQVVAPALKRYEEELSEAQSASVSSSRITMSSVTSQQMPGIYHVKFSI